MINVSSALIVVFNCTVRFIYIVARPFFSVNQIIHSQTSPDLPLCSGSYHSVFNFYTILSLVLEVESRDLHMLSLSFAMELHSQSISMTLTVDNSNK